MSNRRILVSRLVAQFIRVYGNQTFQDGNIGWKWFWLLAEEMSSVFAMERVQQTAAVSLGVGSVMGDGKTVKKLVQQTQDESSVIT